MSYDYLGNKLVVFGGQTKKGSFCKPLIQQFHLPDWMSDHFAIPRKRKLVAKKAKYAMPKSNGGSSVPSSVTSKDGPQQLQLQEQQTSAPKVPQNGPRKPASVFEDLIPNQDAGMANIDALKAKVETFKELVELLKTS